MGENVSVNIVCGDKHHQKSGSTMKKRLQYSCLMLCSATVNGEVALQLLKVEYHWFRLVKKIFKLNYKNKVINS